jgi:prepilin-type N-terminal cleavage/methylation domain-containing protein
MAHGAMKRGFTLLETAMVSALLAAGIAILANFYLGYNTVFKTLEGGIATAGSAGVVGTAVKDAVLEADQVVSSHAFSGTTYTSGVNVLVLELPSADASGNILLGKHDYIAFYRSGTNISRLIDADASSFRTSSQKQLSTSATSLTFTYDNADLTLVQKVDVSIGTAVTVKNRTVQSSLHQQAYLRNK